MMFVGGVREKGLRGRGVGEELLVFVVFIYSINGVNH